MDFPAEELPTVKPKHFSRLANAATSCLLAFLVALSANAGPVIYGPVSGPDVTPTPQENTLRYDTGFSGILTLGDLRFRFPPDSSLEVNIDSSRRFNVVSTESDLDTISLFGSFSRTPESSRVFLTRLAAETWITDTDGNEFFGSRVTGLPVPPVPSEVQIEPLFYRVEKESGIFALRSLLQTDFYVLHQHIGVTLSPVGFFGAQVEVLMRFPIESTIVPATEPSSVEPFVIGILALLGIGLRQKRSASRTTFRG
jgi:hypothetical protein